MVQTRASTRPIISAKPLVDFSKGAAGFPLVGKLPLNSKENLVAELTAAYAQRVRMPTTRPTVIARGAFPHLDALQIDLSDGVIQSGYRPGSLKSVRGLTPLATVKSLSYRAEGLHYDEARQSLSITASDAKISLLTARGEKQVLVMTDAQQGEAHFRVSLADLNALVRDATDDNASRAVFFVDETKLTMRSDNPHSLEAKVDIDGFWLLIPTSITLTGRIDVDDEFNARVSHLTCVGGRVGGPLMASFLGPALKKFDGKTMPLVAFPGDRMHMRDLRISVDDSLRVDAVFGD